MEISTMERKPGWWDTLSYRIYSNSSAHLLEGGRFSEGIGVIHKRKKYLQIVK